MADVVVRAESRGESGVATRELIEFVLLAFAVSWLVGGVAVATIGIWGLGLGALCPGLVALWLTRRHQGSVRPLVQHITRWRLGVRWYAVAVFAPVVVTASAYASVRVAGGEWGSVAEPFAPVELVVFLALALVLNGGPEEPGWRGYALPRLQTRWNALTASVVLAGVWAVWHAPLWFFSELFFVEVNFSLYALQILGMCLVYTWLFNSTGGSILLAVVLHATTNTVQTAFVPSTFAAELATAAAWCLLGAGLLAWRGATNLASSNRIDRRRSLQATAP